MKRIIVAVILILLLSVGTACAADSKVYTAKISLPAVDAEGNGVLSSLEVEIIPGKGRVLLTISPLTGVQTQNSEVTAVDVARKYTNFSFDTHDVIFTIDAGKSAVVEGPSAGAAMTVAVIAAVQKKTIRPDASITGTIQADGKIGPVGGIMEKAIAAAESGDKIILIPEGESIQPIMVEKTEEPAPGWVTKRIVTDYIDITETLEKDHGITVREVATIKDAIDIMLNGANIEVASTLENITAEPMLVIPEVEITEITKPMQDLADKQIETAENAYDEAMERLADPSIDSIKKQFLQNMFSVSEEELAKAKQVREKGYLYGAANYGFRATISSRYVRDLADLYTRSAGDQIVFVGDKITTITSRIKEVEENVVANQDLAADSGAYEWMIAAQERISQAQAQIDEKQETNENILYSLLTAESWADISQNFVEIANQQKRGESLDTSRFENRSQGMIARAEAELNQFDEDDTYGSKWYTSVAKKELEHGWHVSAYVDSSIASMRLETLAELRNRGWSDLVNYIGEELDNINATNSVWGTLYRDYGSLVLEEARNDMDVSKLEESLIYARQAKLYSDLSGEYAGLQKAPFKILSWASSKGISVKTVLISGGALIGFIALLFFINKSIDRKSR